MRYTSVILYSALSAALISCLCTPSVHGAGSGETGMINSGTLGRFNVRLTVSERYGSERFQERVVAGVPFPRGILETTDKLFILNSMRNQCKSRFRPAAYWPDGSVRWVLAEFQTDMTHPTIEEFYLREGTRRHPKRPDRKFYSTLEVIDNEDSFMVDSGVVRLVVRKKGFNLFDRVWVDDTGRLEYNEDSMVVERGGWLRVFDADGKMYSAANDKGIKVSLEDRTMMHAVVTARGKHTDEEGNGLLDFRLRIVVTENSNQVFLEYTLENRGGEPVDLSRITIGVSRKPTENMAYDFLFGTNDGEVSGAVPKGSESKSVLLRVASPYSYSIAGPAAAHSRRGALKGVPAWGSRADFGYGRIFTSARGKMLPTDHCITAAMRDLWQRYPAALELGPALGAAVHCYSGEKDTAKVTLRPGEKLSYSLALSFSGFKPRPKADWAAFTRPLSTACDRSWYCLETACFGPLAPTDSGYFEDERWLDVVAFDSRFRRSFEAVRRTASYGALDYGNFSGGSPCDLAHVLVLQFARTGRADYLDAALLGARRAQRIPPRALTDCATTRGIFDRYCLTGDAESAAAVMLRADYVLKKGPQETASAGSLGASLTTLICGSALSGDNKYLNAALKMAAAKGAILRKAVEKNSPDIAAAADAYEELYDLTEDRGVKEALVSAAKSALSAKRVKPEHLGMLGFAYEHTKDKALLEKAVEGLRDSLSPLPVTGPVLARSGLGALRLTRHMAEIGSLRSGARRRKRKDGEVEIDLVW
jgi:hypothetical protein